MYGQMPFMVPQAAPLSGAIKSSIFSKINIGSILSNTQKTLSVVNQAIPLYYQVKPVLKNLRTLSKIGKEFSKSSTQSNNVSNVTTSENSTVSSSNNNINEVPNPTFFL